MPPLTATGLTPNTTYYVQVVENVNTSSSNFTLCATAPVSCAPPSNFQVGVVTNNTIPIFFSPGLGNTSYTITYTPLGGATQTATFSGLPYTLVNVLPGTPYTLTLTGNCSGGQVSTTVTTTGATLVSQSAAKEVLVKRPAGSIQFAPGSLQRSRVSSRGRSHACSAFANGPST